MKSDTTIIIGKPGSGKSSLLVYFMNETYYNRGEEILEYVRERIEKYNKTRLHPLTPPDKVPIFADFDVTLDVGYNETFKPYWLQGYFFGLPNEDLQVQFICPGSALFFDEAARYYDSRKSVTFPSWCARAYDMRRHSSYDIYMTFTRGIMCDSTIRDTATKVILVINQELIKAGAKVNRTIWRCKEFKGYDEYEAYQKGEIPGEDKTYIYEGNIFDCYDSFAYGDVFLPPDEPGRDFNYFEPLKSGELFNLKKENPELAKFYERREPEGFRTKKKPVKDKPADDKTKKDKEEKK